MRTTKIIDMIGSEDLYSLSTSEQNYLKDLEKIDVVTIDYLFDRL